MAEISIPFKIDLIHGEIQKTVEKIDDIKAILKAFDVVTKQILTNY